MSLDFVQFLGGKLLNGLHLNNLTPVQKKVGNSA
jgi:hypothetical protein